MSTSLASIKAEMKKELANLRGSVQVPSSNKISLDGKVFTLPDGRSSQGPLTAVILDHRNFNTYYEGTFNRANIKRPACFAISPQIADIAPSPNSPKKQAENCHDCENNQWGSAPTGGKGKACKNQVRIAIIEPDCDVRTAEPMIIIVSPTGLSSYSTMIRELEGTGKLPVEVTVDISFNPQQTYPQLVFSVNAPHNRLQEMWGLRQKAQAMLDAEPI